MEEKTKDNPKGFEKVAAFIVDKRKAFYFIYAIIAVFCIISSGWVKVDNKLTDYLDEETETRRGLSIMEEEFTTYATAKIMVDNISYESAEKLSDKLADLNGVKSVAFDDTDKHYNESSALFTLTFEGDEDDEISSEALQNAEDYLGGYDYYISAELGDTKANRINNEINIVMVITCVIIIAVLLFTSKTYMEVPVMLATFGMAALINKGTNFMFGTISFVSNSVAVILQLALAIDYAIILCHRYTEERETKEPYEAVVAALSKAVPEISGSCLTTLSGLAAMMFMHFKIGFDMGIILIKAIIISILCVFTFMPGLIYTFSDKIDKTHHRSFVPNIDAWGRIVIKLKVIAPCIFAGLLVIAFILSNMCPYAYSYTLLSTVRKNDSQIAEQMISETFAPTNVVAILVPTGRYDDEKALSEELSKLPEIDTVTGLSSTEAMDGYMLADKLSPRTFSELTDMDVELVRFLYAAYAVDDENYGKIIGGIDNYEVPLIDMFEFLYDDVDNGTITLDDDLRSDLDEINSDLEDGKKQLKGKNYSRIVLELNLPEETEETFAFLETIRNKATKYYGDDVILCGNSTNDYDLSSTFGQDNLLISILSALFVVIILLFTFQSAGLPIILIIVILGSVWINFSFPIIEGNHMFFLSYLVVSSIQMGANIDYAIVITNRYTELRQTMDKKDAIIKTLSLAFPTIFTSGTILASAGIIIGLMSTDCAIASIGTCLGRGTIISMVLVMGILPQLLLLGDKIIDKTAFKVGLHGKKLSLSGNHVINGKLSGYVNGRVEGSFYGIISGEVDANLLSGSAGDKDGHYDVDSDDYYDDEDDE